MYKKRDTKRVLFLSDMHCGHRWGLTPPRWQTTTIQERFWDWFVKTVRAASPVDVLIVNGDAIDGRGDKNGSVEQITTDRLTQVEMAAEAIRTVDAKTIRIVAGTEYHVGPQEDFELALADRVGGKFSDVLSAEINGTRFSVRHKVGGSSIPHGRATSVMREYLWETYESELRDRDRADVIVRSHVHYFIHVRNSLGEMLITPCLQLGSNFGRRKCSGVSDVGIVYYDCFPGGDRCLTANLLQSPPALSRTEKL